MIYVFSTLTNSQAYGTEIGTITVAGRLAAGKLDTPRGTATQVTEEQLAELRRHVVFASHERNGHLFVSRSEDRVERVVDDMAGPDASAQETDETMAKKRGRPRKAG